MPQMADHKHGSMYTTTQEDTFAGFMNFTKWAVIVILAVIILMAIFIS